LNGWRYVRSDFMNARIDKAILSLNGKCTGHEADAEKADDKLPVRSSKG